MPTLNWTDLAPSRLRVTPHAERETELWLGLTAGERDELVATLEGVFAGETRELRMDCPAQWTLFWKQAGEPGVARALLAHPEPKTWVATLAFGAQPGGELARALALLEPGSRIAVSRWVPIDHLSNFELTVEVISDPAVESAPESASGTDAGTPSRGRV